MRVALFLHRPLLCRSDGDTVRRGRHVNADAPRSLLAGPLHSTLRPVVSGHMHPFRDLVIEGVRHIWMPSTGFVFPDEPQTRQGEKAVGVGLLELKGSQACFGLWCPDGMVRHEVDDLHFFHARATSQKPKPKHGR